MVRPATVAGLVANHEDNKKKAGRGAPTKGTGKQRKTSKPNCSEEEGQGQAEQSYAGPVSPTVAGAGKGGRDRRRRQTVSPKSSTQSPQWRRRTLHRAESGAYPLKPWGAAGTLALGGGGAATAGYVAAPKAGAGAKVVAFEAAAARRGCPFPATRRPWLLRPSVGAVREPVSMRSSRAVKVFRLTARLRSLR